MANTQSYGRRDHIDSSEEEEEEEYKSDNEQYSSSGDSSNVSVTNVTSNARKKLRLNEIYQKNIKEEMNQNTKDLVRKVIKKRIWPNTKFTTYDLVNSVSLTEEGTFLHEVLTGLNLLHYSKCKRLMFWNCYSAEVMDVLSNLKCCVGTGIKGAIIKGIVQVLYIDYILIILYYMHHKKYFIYINIVYFLIINFTILFVNTNRIDIRKQTISWKWN